MAKAVFPGTFDPFTFGHLSIALEAGKTFSEVLILVARNREKKALLSPTTRRRLIQSAIEDIPNLSAHLTAEDTVVFARRHGATAIVRGFRDEADFHQERVLAFLNHDLAPEIETILIPARPEYAEISSTRVKEAHAAGIDISPYCPKAVVEALERKRSRKWS